MARPRRLIELEERVLAAADLPDPPLVVALSGGADSAVCAWAASRSTDEVRAIHVDHGLSHSDVLRAAAEEIAVGLNLTLEVVAVTVPEGPSPEAQAREVRYRGLLSSIGPGEWLLTGHTLDDQAETVLINLLRGAGVDGLAGIPSRRPPIARPLLRVSRSETRELASLLALPWRDDPANLDLAHLRNRIRRRLIPELEARYNPALRRVLARNAEVLALDAAELDRRAEGVRIEGSATGVRMVAGELTALSAAVAARAVRRAFACLDPARPASSEAVQQVLAVVGGGPPSQLPGGWTVRRDGPWVVVEVHPAPEETPVGEVELMAPGVTTWGSWRFEATLEDEPPIIPLSPHGFVHPLGGRIVVRAPRTDDRIRIGRGTKQVERALAEAGVLPERRLSWPVVELDGEVVWIPGVRRAPVAGSGGGRYLSAHAVEESDWDRSGR